MSTQAKSTFELAGWDEKPYDEPDDGPKLSKARVTKSFRGDVEGEGTAEYLVAYAPDGSASFVGLEQVVGKVGDRAGSFVLQHVGTFADNLAKGDVSVVPGSGTGELAGLKGKGAFAAETGPNGTMTLHYDLD